MRYFVTLPNGDEAAVDVVHRPGGKLDVVVDGEPVEVDAVDVEGATNVRVGGRVFDLWLETDGETYGYVGSGHRARARVESDRARSAAASARSLATAGTSIAAPMPGRVVKVLVKEGDGVQAGAPVVVVEAMKMENELCADKPGVVARVAVTVGQTVDGGTVLVELAPSDGQG
jgi:glutaconyl-CoA/methylmalonyl-CoA decarboxylase subunit gamma